MRTLTSIPNVDAPTSEFPSGRIRNKNLIGGTPGTPVIEELYGDIVESIQKLLRLADITPNGLADSEVNGYQILQALGHFIQEPVHNGITLLKLTDFGVDTTMTGLGVCEIYPMNDTDMALVDTVNLVMNTWRFNGTDWTKVGIDRTVSAPGFVGFCVFSPTLAAYTGSDLDTVRTYQWNGNQWSAIGNAFNISIGAGGVRLCKLDTNRIAILTDFGNDLRTLEWDGTNWSFVGTTLTVGGNDMGMCQVRPNYVAISDATAKTVTMYHFTGTHWEQVGAPVVLTGTLTNPMLFAFDDFDILLRSTFMTYILRWNGTTFVPIGERISAGSGISNVRVSILPSKVITYAQPNDDLLKNYIRIAGF